QRCTSLDEVIDWPAFSDASSASSLRSTSREEAEETSPVATLVLCGHKPYQDAKRFHWVPPKGWDSHARALNVSARNNLSWDGRRPIPSPPAGEPWLLPCSDQMALRIARLRKPLVAAGWKVITSSPEVIEGLGDKAKLPDYAAKVGKLDFLPRHFQKPEQARYPCILKPSQGEFGRDSWICYNAQDVMSHVPDFSASNWVLQELVPGSVELSVSMLVSRGTILEVLGMKYLYDREVYIWPGVNELSKELYEVPAHHIPVLAAFVTEYDGILNFNYKIRPDGRICIFEVNTRIGADLACDAPRERARQLFLMLDKIRG
ncbi:APUM3, partial [Symbiodinium pilosum]